MKINIDLKSITLKVGILSPVESCIVYSMMFNQTKNEILLVIDNIVVDNLPSG